MYKKEEDTTSGSTGLLGRFRQRINQIRRDLAIKNKKEQEEQDEFIKEKVEEIKKTISKEKKISKKGIVKKSTHKKGVFNNDEDTKTKKTNEDELTKPQAKNNYPHDTVENNKEVVVEDEKNNKKDEETPSSNQDAKKDYNYNKAKFKGINNPKEQSFKNKDQESTKDNNPYLEELKDKIIKKIRNDFLKKLSELEVLENELYNLKEKTEYEIELDKIKEIKEKINETIKKINAIIEEYNIYRTSYDLGNVIDLNDTLIIDDIIEYRHLVESDSLNKKLIKEYKLLEEYQKLYNNLEKIKSLSDEVINNNKLKLSELEEKEDKHEHIKNSVNTLDEVMNKCNEEINNQNRYLDELMSKVNNINKEEITHYKFKSLNNIINSSLLFLTTISLSKRMPLVPKIFINTMATNNLVRNIYRSMLPEKIKEVNYSAINYDKEISSKINDIDYTSLIISDTLTTINNIKSEFLSQYNSQIPGYTDTLNKINKIEEVVINNQYKIETIKDKLSIGRKQNQEKILKLENLKKNSQIN